MQGIQKMKCATGWRSVHVKRRGCERGLMEEKKKYYVSLQAEGVTEGYIYLTNTEYEIVKKATSTTNWDGLRKEPWSGRFVIDPYEQWYDESSEDEQEDDR